ncbi:MAG: xanthine dehydrogenase [Candidatus Cloacimonetes bacterium HGW-Cloacimonetes-3]|jgi:xanthine dehydrogenase small subunit|nr:MAG: xanthine dehydrogenase [Candidatus Cloacimonetes bacterium HGW-Cloacimonetes-3]
MQDKLKSKADELVNRITFYLNGKLVTETIPAGLSTLDWLNQTKHMFGTKCSCNEGDCGACTVVLAYPRDGSIVYEAINSCLYPAAKLHGRHLITIEAVGEPDKLHPIQQALLEHHGTQCGYCTPGFVMSMFAMFATITHPDKETIFSALEGNLCRCTGYQSILEAAEEVSEGHTPQDIVPEWCRQVEEQLISFKEPAEMQVINTPSPRLVQRYLVPEDFNRLFDYFAMEPEAVFIAGGTDIMVQMNISRKAFPVLIDLSRIPHLQRLYLQKDGLHIGAGITYSQLLDSGIVKSDYPMLHHLISQIASQQIRNFGTLAGNIANASPIGDSLPALLAMDATLSLQSELEVRSIPLREFFLGYRQTALRKGEIIREVILPVMPAGAYLNCLKSAKRKSVDISAVITAIKVEASGGVISSAVLALGGVAATPVISKLFPGLVQGHETHNLDIQAIARVVAGEFIPISDVRGGAEYRSTLIAKHIEIYLEELKGGQA